MSLGCWPRPRRRVFTASIVALMLAGGGQSAGADVARVHNRAPRAGDIESVRMQELWRAGGQDDEVFFGNVLQVLGGPEGEVFVLDVQLVKTFVFSKSGVLLRELGGEGEGPGEVTNINSILLTSDGRLGQGQVLPGRIVFVDRQGEPSGSMRLTDPEGSFVLLMNGQANEDLLLLAGMRWSMSEEGELVQNMFLRRYEHDGTPGHDFCTKESAFDAANFVFDELKFDFIWNRFAVTAEGLVCFAPHRNAYEIHACRADGTPVFVATRDYESLQRDDEARTQARLTHEALGSHYGRQLMGVTVEDAEPDIVSLWPSPDGTLWVRTSRGDRERPAGVLTTVDVLDGRGQLIAQRQLVCPGDPERDGIHFLPGDRVVVVRGAAEAGRREVGSTTAESMGGDAAELEVVCYGVGMGE